MLPFIYARLSLISAPITKSFVLILALKPPDASLATIAFAVLALVAVVALLDTLPAVLIVANLVSTIPAEALISPLTIVPSAIIALVTTPAAIEVALPTDVTSPVKFAFVVTVDALLADVANEADVAVPVKLPVNDPLNDPDADRLPVVDE